MLTPPQIERREAQPYAGLAARAPQGGLGSVVDRGFPRLFGWLAAHGLAPAGPPFIRYRRVDDPSALEIELCVPTGAPVAAEDDVLAGELPAGNYATAQYFGAYDGLADATAALLRWGERQGVDWRRDGERWVACVERYLTDPSSEPDPAKRQTELAILTTA